MARSLISQARLLDMTETSTVYSIILALLFAVAAGLVGSFALMKRMILGADVISHVALPGLGLAFLWHFNPLLGGGAALFLGTLLIWQLQKKESFSTEVAIGVVFAGSVAIGAALTPKEDLVDVLRQVRADFRLHLSGGRPGRCRDRLLHPSFQERTDLEFVLS
jgi:ABC-type Mn2+/Zn2+ transport system permease subunit